MEPSSTLRLLERDRRAAGVLIGVVALQLTMSIRFFFKYVEAAPWAAYGLYVVLGVVLSAAILRSSRLLLVLSHPGTLAVALAILLGMVLVAYPKADALRAVGRGSDQDDCVRTMVDNILAGRAPFGYGYFDDPCSTGPSEFFVYFPVHAWSTYFVVVPVLAILLGYWALTRVTDRPAAVLLSLTQLTSWLFLEMSAVGSDMLILAWLLAAAVVGAVQGLDGHDTVLTVLAGVAYFLFAGSRLPLVLTAAGSLWVLLLVFGARALRFVVPVALATAATYLGTYAMAPSRFTPGHLVGKSARIWDYLVGDAGPVLGAAIVLVVLTAAAGSARPAARAFARRHYYGVNLVILAVPMVAVAAWDLSRRDFDPALFEGLHYLYFCVPMLLVMAGSRLSAAAERTVGRTVGPALASDTTQ